MLQNFLKYTKHFFIIAVACSFILAGCEKALQLKEPVSDPLSVFDEAWKVMDQHYALFQVKSIDWNLVYNQYRLQLTANSTGRELFNVISNMFETLKDGHVTLISPLDTSTYEGFYTAYPANFNYRNILNNYLKNDFQISGPVIYKVDNSIGYIYYNSFKNDITDAELDIVMNKMSTTKGLIVDVRNNSGGNLENADRFFQRFIAGKTLVKYEVIKNGTGHNDFLEPDPYYLNPSGFYYNKPVCVLTNRACFSACNDFVMYMSSLLNVKLIGDQTGGGGGIPYNYILANGWKIQYTATITLSLDKVNIESGILPDVPAVITPVDETNGKDPILDKAIQLLQ